MPEPIDRVAQLQHLKKLAQLQHLKKRRDDLNKNIAEMQCGISDAELAEQLEEAGEQLRSEAREQLRSEAKKRGRVEGAEALSSFGNNMQHSDFSIGLEFYCGGNRWRCTDVGSRVIVAIQPVDGWDAGPPYAILEHAFDEYDIQGCSKQDVPANSDS